MRAADLHGGKGCGEGEGETVAAGAEGGGAEVWAVRVGEEMGDQAAGGEDLQVDGFFPGFEVLGPAAQGGVKAGWGKRRGGRRVPV